MSGTIALTSVANNRCSAIIDNVAALDRELQAISTDPAGTIRRFRASLAARIAAVNQERNRLEAEFQKALRESAWELGIVAITATVGLAVGTLAAGATPVAIAGGALLAVGWGTFSATTTLIKIAEEDGSDTLDWFGLFTVRQGFSSAFAPENAINSPVARALSKIGKVLGKAVTVLTILKSAVDVIVKRQALIDYKNEADAALVEYFNIEAQSDRGILRGYRENIQGVRAIILPAYNACRSIG